MTSTRPGPKPLAKVSVLKTPERRQYNCSSQPLDSYSKIGTQPLMPAKIVSASMSPQYFACSIFLRYLPDCTGLFDRSRRCCAVVEELFRKSEHLAAQTG